MKTLLWALAVLLWATCADAQPIRVLVAASENQGLAEQGVLKHADQDAALFRNVFVSQGRVDAKRAFLVQHATKDSLFAALDRARLAASARPRDEVTFIFYFSGHGDRNHLDLAGDAVSIQELKRRIQQVPAGLHLVVIDACRTANPMRTKGVASAAPFSIAIAAPPASGSVWLYAAADGEAAQESDELGGAVFTHFFVTGLRGAADSNRDHRVTLSEAWSYAYHQTLYRSARGAGVSQRPAAHYDLAESAPLVLTYEDRHDAELTLPASRDTHYLLYATGSKTVAAELWSAPNRPARVALPAGQYIVQRRGAAGAGAVQINLASGENRALQPSSFHPVALEELAAKGGTLVLRPNEVFISGGAETGTLDSVMPRVGLGAATRFGDFALGIRLGGARGRYETGANQVSVTALDATLEVERVVRLLPFEVRLGLGPTLMQVWETLRRRDAGVVAPLGYQVEQSYSALAAGATAGVSGRYVFGNRAFVELAIRGGALGVRRQSRVALLWTASAGGAAGILF